MLDVCSFRQLHPATGLPLSRARGQHLLHNQGASEALKEKNGYVGQLLQTHFRNIFRSSGWCLTLGSGLWCFGGFSWLIYMFMWISPLFNVYHIRFTGQARFSNYTINYKYLNLPGWWTQWQTKESTLWINGIQRGRFLEICWISTDFYHVLSSQNIVLRLDGDMFSWKVVLFCVGMLKF